MPKGTLRTSISKYQDGSDFRYENKQLLDAWITFRDIKYGDIHIKEAGGQVMDRWLSIKQPSDLYSYFKTNKAVNMSNKSMNQNQNQK